jgi:hypothetical protein
VAHRQLPSRGSSWRGTRPARRGRRGSSGRSSRTGPPSPAPPRTRSPGRSTSRTPRWCACARRRRWPPRPAPPPAPARRSAARRGARPPGRLVPTFTTDSNLRAARSVMAAKSWASTARGLTAKDAAARPSSSSREARPSAFQDAGLHSTTLPRRSSARTALAAESRTLRSRSRSASTGSNGAAGALIGPSGTGEGGCRCGPCQSSSRRTTSYRACRPPRRARCAASGRRPTVRLPRPDPARRFWASTPDEVQARCASVPAVTAGPAPRSPPTPRVMGRRPPTPRVMGRPLASARPLDPDWVRVEEHELANGLKVRLVPSATSRRSRLHLLPRRLAQRASGHHRHRPPLRAHDVQRGGQVRPQGVRPPAGEQRRPLQRYTSHDVTPTTRTSPPSRWAWCSTSRATACARWR